MGNNGGTPVESAPSYDDLFADHPVNQHPPSGSAAAYARVPQEVPQEQPHQHDAASAEVDLEASDTPLQALSGSSRPHTHCEACDKIMTRRESVSQERHCCTMVSATFMVAFLCLMLWGIVIASKKYHD